MDDLRVAVVGYGLIGRRRAKALGEISGATLAATVDPRVDPSSELTPSYTSLDDLPPTSYDAAIVAVPHDVSAGLACHVLRLGKPVLLEKPLGISAAEAKAIVGLAADLGSPSFVGYNYRFLPAVKKLLRAIADGELGQLRSVDMLVGHGGHPESAQSWKLDRSRAGGGVLLDPGVHLLDLLSCIAPAAKAASAEMTSGFWGTDVEEDVVLTFRDDQLLATLRISHIRWINTFRVEVFGEEGYAIAEGRGGNYGPMSYRSGRRWAWAEEGASNQRETEQVAKFGVHDDSLRDELAAIVRAWKQRSASSTDVPHPATMAEAFGVAKLCEALYEGAG
jgi:predicted dehydrogenase